MLCCDSGGQVWRLKYDACGGYVGREVVGMIPYLTVAAAVAY